MHKYIPRVHIVRADDLMKINFCEFVTFSFEESEFIAVTAYQNEQVSVWPIHDYFLTLLAPLLGRSPHTIYSVLVINIHRTQFVMVTFKRTTGGWVGGGSNLKSFHTFVNLSLGSCLVKSCHVKSSRPTPYLVQPFRGFIKACLCKSA